MSELLDPWHRSLLKAVGLQPGWRCLEVGCGNGSISRWLSTQTTGGGSVVATDLDISYIADPRRPGLLRNRCRIADFPGARVEKEAASLV